MWPSAKYPALSATDIPQLFDADPTFDFIIIGGGTAGCCLASRLSEDPAVKVLLIERGPVSDDWQAHVPLASANIYRPAAPAAIFPVSPLSQVNDRVIHAVIGEGLGGGSLINSSLYTRGIADFNKWKEMGRENWGYDALEPYFVKSENTLSQRHSNFRGKGGLWTNQTFPEPLFEIHRRMTEAATSIGIPHISDLNSPDAPAICCPTLDVTTDINMHRHSTFKAFLSPQIAQERKTNLKICTDTIVTRIKCTTAGTGKPRALGVYFQDTHLTRKSRTFYARASREVILCAGAIASPQILMLSGIGPEDHLRSFSIPVVRHLSGVGSYLRDHVGIPISYQVPMTESLNVLRNNIFRAILEVLKYIVFGTGLLSIPFMQTTIFARSSLLNENMEVTSATPADLDSRDPKNIPDVELMPIAHRGGEGENDPLDRVGVFTLLAALVTPKSSGTVRLPSTDPHARARIDLGYLSDPADLPMARKAVRLALRLAQQVRTRGYPLGNLLVPESEDEASLDKFVRDNLRTTYHYTSTCRMAPE
ncbi:alcohol oxidase, partial [Mycena sp. CBHHK59/15]